MATMAKEKKMMKRGKYTKQTEKKATFSEEVMQNGSQCSPLPG